MIKKVEVRVRNVPWRTKFFQLLPCSEANVIFYQKVKNKMRGLLPRFQNKTDENRKGAINVTSHVKIFACFLLKYRISF